MRGKDMAIILTTIPVLFMVGCGADNGPQANFDTLDKSLWSVKNTNPKKEARLAFNAGDRRFLSVDCYAVHVPGLTNDDYDRYLSKLDARLITGTSDMIGNEKIGELMDSAEWYATEYNKEILRCLESARPNHNLECKTYVVEGDGPIPYRGEGIYFLLKEIKDGKIIASTVDKEFSLHVQLVNGYRNEIVIRKGVNVMFGYSAFGYKNGEKVFLGAAGGGESAEISAPHRWDVYMLLGIDSGCISNGNLINNDPWIRNNMEYEIKEDWISGLVAMVKSGEYEKIVLELEISKEIFRTKVCKWETVNVPVTIEIIPETSSTQPASSATSKPNAAGV